MDMKAFIVEYWNSTAAKEKEKMREFFHKDACIRLHNTNELFNAEEFFRANCNYPGVWRCEVERIEQIKNTVITVARVWSNDSSFHATSFFEITNGKIITLDEYWGDDGLAPQWRREMNIGQSIL